MNKRSSMLVAICMWLSVAFMVVATATAILGDVTASALEVGCACYVVLVALSVSEYMRR